MLLLLFDKCVSLKILTWRMRSAGDLQSANGNKTRLAMRLTLLAAVVLLLMLHSGGGRRPILNVARAVNDRIRLPVEARPERVAMSIAHHLARRRAELRVRLRLTNLHSANKRTPRSHTQSH